MLPRVSRLGPAADDELLLLVELQLPPRRAAAARLVRRLPVLDDEPFPSFLQRPRVQRAAVALDLLAQANRVRLRLRSAEQSFEPHAALDERQAAQIVLPLAQQIERDEGDRLLAVDALDVFRVAQVNPALEPLESHGLTLRIERDDLAVDDERLASGGAERGERRHDGRELRRFVVAESRPHAHERARSAGAISPSARDARARSQ